MIFTVLTPPSVFLKYCFSLKRAFLPLVRSKYLTSEALVLRRKKRPLSPYPLSLRVFLFNRSPASPSFLLASLSTTGGALEHVLTDFSSRLYLFFLSFHIVSRRAFSFLMLALQSKVVVRGLFCGCSEIFPCFLESVPLNLYD